MKIARILLLCSALIPVAALAQSGTNPMQDQLDRMERDLNMLQKDYYRNKPGQISLDNVTDKEAKALLQQQQQFQANMELRFNQIDEQMRQINGKIEEQDHENHKLSEELRKLSDDVNFRFGALEKNNKNASESAEQDSDSGAKEVKGDGTKVLGTVVVDPSKPAFVAPKEKPQDLGDPKKRYDEAFDLLRQAKYPQAQKAFEAFIQDFPEHNLTPSAYFWLGETYYIRKDYELAAVQYLKGYRKAPKGAKAPDNLLKLAISLGGAKKQTEACTVFEKLGKEFPNAAAPIKRKAELERTKLKCGR